MNVFGIGPMELLVVALVGLLVLGPSRMVDVARMLGKQVRELQRATSEVPRLLSLDEPLEEPPKRQQLPDQPAASPEAPPPSSEGQWPANPSER